MMLVWTLMSVSKCIVCRHFFWTIQQYNEVYTILWRSCLFFLDVQNFKNRAETSFSTAPWINLRYLGETFCESCRSGCSLNLANAQEVITTSDRSKYAIAWESAVGELDKKQNNLLPHTHTHRHRIHHSSGSKRPLQKFFGLGQSLGHGHLES